MLDVYILLLEQRSSQMIDASLLPCGCSDLYLAYVKKVF